MNTPSRWRSISLALALASTILVFAPSITNGFVWDDAQLIVHNQFVHAPSSLRTVFTTDFWNVSVGDSPSGYWRPLVTLAYIVQWKLFGPAPLGWHCVNVILHLACVSLVSLWLWHRLGENTPPTPDSPSITTSSDTLTARHRAFATFVGSALFALHPTRPETVSWISGSTDLWATLFVLISLDAWRRQSPRTDLLAGVTLALAVTAKESVLAVPLALAADLFLSSQPSGLRSLLHRLAAVTLPMLLVTFTRLFWVPLPHPPTLTTSALDLPSRVLSTLGHTVRLALSPIPPSVYSAPTTFGPDSLPSYSPWSIALGALTLFSLSLTVLFSLRHSRLRPWLRDLSWFFLTLAPALNFFPLRLETLLAPRFLYLPLLGLCAFVSRLVFSLPTAHHRIVTIVSLSVLLTSASLSLEHSSHFSSDLALFSYEHSVHPELCLTSKRLALAYSSLNDHNTALRYERLRYVCLSRHHGRPIDLAQASIDLANRVATITPDADQQTLTLIRNYLRAFDPTQSLSPRLDLGDLHFFLSPVPAVRATLWPGLQSSLAILEARTLDLSSAETRLREALSRSPRNPTAWRNLIVVLSTSERWPEAHAACSIAQHSNPANTLLSSLCQFVSQSLSDTTPPPSDPFTARLAIAQRRLTLGARELSRLDALSLHQQFPSRPEPIVLLARADLADGRTTNARDTLVRNLTTLPPASRPPLQALLSQLNQHSSSTHPHP